MIMLGLLPIGAMRQLRLCDALPREGRLWQLPKSIVPIDPVKCVTDIDLQLVFEENM